MFSNIDIKELKKIIGRANIIDIRDKYIYKLGNIPTAKNVPMKFLLVNSQEYLNKLNTYYIYCEYGTRSKEACKKLLSMGYNAIDIIGGYQAYLKN